MRKNKLIALLLSAGLTLTACAGGSSESVQTTTAEQTVEVTKTESETTEAPTTEDAGQQAGEVYIEQKPENTTEKYVLKAADAKTQGKCKVNGSGDDAYVDGLEGDGDKMIFTVDVKDGFFFDITVNGEGIGGSKINYVNVDNDQAGGFELDNADKKSATLSRVYVPSGAHEISITKSWGYIKVNSIELNMCDALDADIYDIPATLIDAKADESAQRLMNYLTDIYGKYIITGQYIDNGEVDAIYEATGKRPAIWGYDVNGYTSTSKAFGVNSTVVQTMINLHNANPSIIYTLCWHWLAPQKYIKNTDANPWYSGFRPEATTIDLTAIMNGDDPEGYDLLVADIDMIAEQLKLLEEAGIPILWRPLHEASGGWFWWGKFGPDTYKELWKLIYDRIVNVNDVHNCIWLWNGQSGDWYPGDEYVDIIGEDIYPGNHVSSSQASKFFEAKNYTAAKKMVVLSENGCIPDIDLCRRDGAMWGFFAVWNGEFIKTGSMKSEISEEYTKLDIIKKMYTSEYAITLDEVPDLSTY